MKKKCFTLAIIKKDDEDIESSIKCWICDNIYGAGDVKVRDHHHLTGKYRSPAQEDCNLKVKLNYKIPIVLHNLKNYDSHLIMQKLGKFDFKINVMPNGLEKYMTFNINDKLIFVGRAQFVRSQLCRLVQSLGKNDFKHLNQEFDSKVLYLLKQRGFLSYEYISGFQRFKEELSSKQTKNKKKKRWVTNY